MPALRISTLRYIMNADFKSRHDPLLDTLASLRDPQQRLAWVIDRARQSPPFPAEWHLPDCLVPGCAARLWLRGWSEDSSGSRVCRFAADSDSAILKAFAALLCGLYDGLPADEILTGEPEFLRRTGLLSQLTENRQRTVLRVFSVIREFAAASVPPSNTARAPISPLPS